MAEHGLDEVEDSLEQSYQLPKNDKQAAEILLRDHTVNISRHVDVFSLIPYLYQNECVTEDEMKQFSRKDTRSDNNMKLLKMIRHRGVSGFNGFLKSLAKYTAHEKGEGNHIDLLESLKRGVNNRRRHQSRTGSVTSDTRSITSTPSVVKMVSIPEDGTLDEIDTVEPDNPMLIRPKDEESDESRSKQKEETVHVTHKPQKRDDETVLVPPPSSSSKGVHVRDFKYVLRGAVAFTCICFPVFLIGGVTLLALSIKAFKGNENCRELFASHSLTVFNFFYGLLCLTVAVVLSMLVVYFLCENRNSKWKEQFQVWSSKCLVVWMTIISLLVLLILIIIELLYSLVYIAPQVYSRYADRNDTKCADEVYVTSFSLLNFSGVIIFIVLTVFGVYLSILYFRWVTDPHKHGTLRRLIEVLCPASYSATSPSSVRGETSGASGDDQKLHSGNDGHV